MCVQFQVDSVEGREYLEAIGVHWSVMLKGDLQNIGSGQASDMGISGYGYEPLDSIKADELYQELSDYWLFKEVYLPWRYIKTSKLFFSKL